MKLYHGFNAIKNIFELFLYLFLMELDIQYKWLFLLEFIFKNNIVLILINLNY